jgi:hypothetical protein
MINKIMITVIIGLFLNSCYTNPQRVRSGFYSNQPKKKEYKLSKKPFYWNSIIDTSSVYICESERTLNGNPLVMTLYNFIRYSGTGVAFISDNYDRVPVNSDFNTMEYGQFVLYKINDRKITLEIYNHLLRRFDYWYGAVIDSAVILNRYKGRTWWHGKGRLYQKVFNKTEANLTTPILFPE